MTTDALSRHQPLADDDFLAQFKDCTLEARYFNHIGHLRAAFLMLERQPMLLAQKDYSTSLQRYAASLGVPEKYHATATYALLALMAARQGVQRCPDWRSFLARNADLVNDAQGLLLQYYRAETLASEQARKQFVLPDRTSLAELLKCGTAGQVAPTG